MDDGELPALAHQNIRLFAEPAVRDVIRSVTGLSEEQLDGVASGLARIGVALLLPNGADTQAKYANGIPLVRDHGYSVYKAAKTVGISSTHRHRKMTSIGTDGELKAQADAGDRRILEMSQALSTLSGEVRLERLEQEGNRMKTTELAKIYTAFTNQVAAKQRWSQGNVEVGTHSRITGALRDLLEEADLTLSKRDPAKEAVDVTLEDAS